MQNLAIPIFICVAAGAAFGYSVSWAIEALKMCIIRRVPATKVASSDAFPIIDEWANRERWYLESGFLRHAAEVEHVRLLRDEPELTVEENLCRVASAVKQRYPGAFRTLH